MTNKIVVGLIVTLLVLVGCLREPSQPMHVWCNDLLVEVEYMCFDEKYNINKSGIEGDVRVNLYEYSKTMDEVLIKHCGSKEGGMSHATKTIKYLC